MVKKEENITKNKSSIKENQFDSEYCIKECDIKVPHINKIWILKVEIIKRTVISAHWWISREDWWISREDWWISREDKSGSWTIIRVAKESRG